MLGLPQSTRSSTPSKFSALPNFQVENAISGPGLTAFGILPQADMAFFLDALEENQYLRLLANPTLVALNGEEAGFLAGGEFVTGELLIEQQHQFGLMFMQGLA